MIVNKILFVKELGKMGRLWSAKTFDFIYIFY